MSAATLRRWDAQGIASPDARTLGGHRRYSAAQVEALMQRMKGAQ